MTFPLIKLAQVASKIGSGSTPRGGDSVYIDSGTALIRSQNVYNSEFYNPGLVYIDEQTAEKMQGVTVEPDDVLLNITGDSVARCCLVRDEVLPARVNQHVAIIRANKEKINPSFLMFYLTSPQMQAKMLSLAGAGGTRKALTKAMIENFDIPLPKIEDQRLIASALNKFNEAIDNNRRRVRLLEESARLLYREWFVYFRFPGHEHSKMINGLPEGWVAGVVSDLGHVVTGKTPSTADQENFGGNIPFIKTPDMHASSIIVSTEEYLSDKGARSQGKKFIPANSILVACIGAKLGVVSINATKAQTNQQINSIIPNNSIFTYYAYFTLKGFREKLLAIGGGATMPNVNKRKFESMSITLPDPAILNAFHESVESSFKQMRVLIYATRKLEQARDMLLPRLMNGDIAV